MFLGFDDSLKGLKKELKEAGVDMNVVREWQKCYDKVRRQKPQLENQYRTARNELETILSLLKGMEQDLISNRDGADFSGYVKELKKYQEHFNHEFLISKEDSDFHSTYESILRLCGKNSGEQSELLILQSEVENMIALVSEALEKELPDFYAMAFYYLGRSDREIFELPHADKVAKVRRVHENEFLKPMRDCMAGHVSEERVKMILEDELWK